MCSFPKVRALCYLTTHSSTSCTLICTQADRAGSVLVLVLVLVLVRRIHATYLPTYLYPPFQPLHHHHHHQSFPRTPKPHTRGVLNVTPTALKTPTHNNPTTSLRTLDRYPRHVISSLGCSLASRNAAAW